MDEIMVVYWSQTGNTEAMAQAVAQGIDEAGKKAKLAEVSAVDPETLKGAKAIALGCPAMGAEVLEEDEMEPFVAALEGFVSGKTVGLFGSYGWGDGQWMRDWVDRMSSAGANVLNGEGVICKEAPDDEAVAACTDLGRQLAAV